jgi:hypothetical protein
MRGAFRRLGWITRHFARCWRGPRGLGIWDGPDGYWRRWQEVARGGKEGGDPNKVDADIDDEVMMHVFNMYAAYAPPHLRTLTLVVADQSKTTDTGDTSKITTDVTPALTVNRSEFFVRPKSCPRRRDPKPSLLTHPVTEAGRCHSRSQNSIQQDSARPQRRGFHCYSLLTLRRQSVQGCVRHWTLQGRCFGRSLKIRAWRGHRGYMWKC